MKALILLLATLGLPFFLVGCSKKEVAAAEEKKPDSTALIHHGTNGEVVVTLDAETQKRIGLTTASPDAAQLAPEIKTIGRVLDPAIISPLVGDLLAARAAADASRKELERSQTLLKSDNVSARLLQTAEANAARDTALRETARAKLIATLGNELANRSDLSELVNALAANTRALVRLELPAGESADQPNSARLVSLNGTIAPTVAKFLNTAAIDPQFQTRGLLFLVDSNSPALSPGEAVTGYIKLSGALQTGVSVPRQSVVRKDGFAWAYVQSSATEFTRRAVATDSPVASGWFVTNGFAAGDKIVTTGAQVLLSTEMMTSAAGEPH